MEPTKTSIEKVMGILGTGASYHQVMALAELFEIEHRVWKSQHDETRASRAEVENLKAENSKLRAEKLQPACPGPITPIQEAVLAEAEREAKAIDGFIAAAIRETGLSVLDLELVVRRGGFEASGTITTIYTVRKRTLGGLSARAGRILGSSAEKSPWGFHP